MCASVCANVCTGAGSDRALQDLLRSLLPTAGRGVLPKSPPSPVLAASACSCSFELQGEEEQKRLLQPAVPFPVSYVGGTGAAGNVAIQKDIHLLSMRVTLRNRREVPHWSGPSLKEPSHISLEAFTSHFPNTSTADGADVVRSDLGFVLQQRTSSVALAKGSVSHVPRIPFRVLRNQSKGNSNLHGACFLSRWWSCSVHQNLVSSLQQQAAFPTPTFVSRKQSSVVCSHPQEPHQAAELLCYRQVTLGESFLGGKMLSRVSRQLKLWQRWALKRDERFFV